MYVVEVFDALGDPAEFVLASPLVALDLALRAQRAGLRWQMSDQQAKLIALEDIRHAARAAAAADLAAAEHLHQIERDHDDAVRAGLN